MKDGGPAFPRDSRVGAEFSNDGMSLRDWFAGMALNGMIASSPLVDRTDPGAINHPRWAKQAYVFAEAMLKEGEK